MAIEDGASLAEAIGLATNRSELAMCLELWQRIRIKRTSQMQQASLFGAYVWHIADGPEQRARDASMLADVECRPSQASPNPWSDPATQRWCYGYDAEREIKAEWAISTNARL